VGIVGFKSIKDILWIPEVMGALVKRIVLEMYL